MCSGDKIYFECYLRERHIFAPVGLIPTFGPSWINFYGAPRSYKMMEEHEDLNNGLGEGVAFRGR